MTEEEKIIEDNIMRRYPASDDAEKAVLSCMMLNPDEVIPEALSKLTRDHFYTSAHQRIFDVIVSLWRNGGVDLVLLCAEFERLGEMEEVKGVAYLADIATDVPTSEMFSGYAEKLEEKFAYRRLIEVCTKIASEGFDQQKTPETLCKRLEEVVSSILEKRVASYDTSSRAALMEFLTEFEEAVASKRSLPGISTGFSELDEMTNGFIAGHFWVLAGLSGSGKSAMMVQWVKTVSHHEPCAVISLEMDRSSLIGRLVSGDSGINSLAIARGDVHGPDLHRIQKSVSKLSELPFFVDDRPGLTMMEVEAQVRRWVRDFGVKVVFVDYLQLLQSEGKEGADEHVKVERKATALLNLAKRYKVTIVALAQFNRQVKKEARPRKEQLRGSSAIENHAHVIVLLHRPYPDDANPEIDVEMIVDKCRHGREDSFITKFDRETTTFEVRHDEEN